MVFGKCIYKLFKVTQNYMKYKNVFSKAKKYKQEEIGLFCNFQFPLYSILYLSISVPSRTALRRIGFALFLDLTTFV